MTRTVKEQEWRFYYPEYARAVREAYYHSLTMDDQPWLSTDGGCRIRMEVRKPDAEREVRIMPRLKAVARELFRICMDARDVTLARIRLWIEKNQR
jgi:hypothetical protein